MFMEVQPVTASDATTIAAAVLFTNLISYPKTRLFNGTPTYQFAADVGYLLFMALWLFRGGGPGQRQNSPSVGQLPKRARRNGIAIRACFGKPAFVCMQHRLSQVFAFDRDRQHGNIDVLRPVQEEKP
jgi:hypothetical protein